MIETKRLRIRPFLSSDSNTVFDWFFDSDVMRWIPGGPDSSLSDHKRRIQNYAKHFEEFGFSKYLLIEKATGENISDAGILHLDQTNMIELGYRIKKSRWRQGFATEACQAIIEHTFTKNKIDEINAIVEAENVVSVKILENSLGFHFLRQGIFLGVPMHLYGLNIRDSRKYHLSKEKTSNDEST